MYHVRRRAEEASGVSQVGALDRARAQGELRKRSDIIIGRRGCSVRNVLRSGRTTAPQRSLRVALTTYRSVPAAAQRLSASAPRAVISPLASTPHRGWDWTIRSGIHCDTGAGIVCRCVISAGIAVTPSAPTIVLRGCPAPRATISLHRHQHHTEGAGRCA